MQRFVESDKVAIVAMESCEFCWTIFKLLDAIGVSYSKLNFDSIEYAPNNLGNVIRASVQGSRARRRILKCLSAASLSAVRRMPA